MKKHIFSIVGIIVALVMVFTACTAGNGEKSANGTTAPSETVSTVLIEGNTSEVTTESTTETTTESTTGQTSKAQTTEKKTEPKQTTTKKESSPQKHTTTKKAQAQTSERAKQTTTKKVTTTKKTTTSAPYWCDEGGTHHSCEVGPIGWVNSYAEAQKKALRYIDDHADSGNFLVKECHNCGKYTAYVTLD